MSYAEAQLIVDRILCIIKERLARGEKVLLSRFGCFRVVDRKQRKGVNPATGETMIIRRRKAVVFKPGGPLKSV